MNAPKNITSDPKNVHIRSFLFDSPVETLITSP